MPNTVSVTWHTQGDGNVCPICKALEGYTWTFVIGEKGGMPDTLTHPAFSEVWNMQMGSLAHEHKGFKGALTSNCRCKVEQSDINVDELFNRLQKVCDVILNASSEVSVSNEIDDTISGSYRRTTPEDIGVTI